MVNTMGFDEQYKEFERSYATISNMIDKKVKAYEKEAEDYLKDY